MDIVPLIFGGILEEKPWLSLLDHLRDEFQAMHASMTFRMPQDGPPRPFLSDTRSSVIDIANDNLMTRAYLDEFFAHDPLYSFDLRPGDILTFDDIVPRAELEATVFYQRYLRRFGVIYGLKMCFQEPGGLKAWLMFSRDEAAGNFDEAVKRRLQDLLPHLELALQIYSRLMLKEIKAEIYSKSMSQLVIGAIIVDGTGRVIDLNDAARRLMAQSASIEIRRGRLFSTNPRINRELSSLLNTVLQAGRGPSTGFCSRTISIHAEEGHIGVLIKSVPRGDWYDGGSSPQAIVYLRDPRSPPIASEALLRELFSLSPAEARIALLLASGKTIAATAEHLSLNENTVRTQTKRIFSKTRIGRQGDLIILVNQSVAQLSGDHI